MAAYPIARTFKSSETQLQLISHKCDRLGIGLNDYARLVDFALSVTSANYSHCQPIISTQTAKAMPRPTVCQSRLLCNGKILQRKQDDQIPTP
jgi:hypothetical protein